jgi:hypothetical protein
MLGQKLRFCDVKKYQKNFWIISYVFCDVKIVWKILDYKLFYFYVVEKTSEKILNSKFSNSINTELRPKNSSITQLYQNPKKLTRNLKYDKKYFKNPKIYNFKLSKCQKTKHQKNSTQNPHHFLNTIKNNKTGNTKRQFVKKNQPKTLSH